MEECNFEFSRRKNRIRFFKWNKVKVGEEVKNNTVEINLIMLVININVSGLNFFI